MTLIHSKFSGFIFIVSLLFVFSMSGNARGHNFIGKVGCFECHERLPLSGSAFMIKTNIEKICERCHNLGNRLSHPVGMIPKIMVPVDMPLDKEGRISCVTCHDVHMADVNKLTGKKTFHLRRTLTGKKFCYSCHVKLP